MLQEKDICHAHSRSGPLVVPKGEELKCAAIRQLRENLACGELLHPFHRAIREDHAIQIQEFFKEAEADYLAGRPGKPVFFSPSSRSIVLSEGDFSQVADDFLEVNVGERAVNALRLFSARCVEFQLHEYGHIAAHNGLVRECAHGALSEKKETIIRAFDLPPEIRRAFRHAELDLQGERWRIGLPQAPFRDVGSFAVWGYNERLKEGGVYTRPPNSADNLIYWAIWSPEMEHSFRDRASSIEAGLCDRAARYGDYYKNLYLALSEYFKAYFASLQVVCR